MSTKFLNIAIGLTTDVEKKANELAEVNEKYDAKKVEITRYEASIMQAIASETVEEEGKDGLKTKAKYSNDAARGAELTARKAKSDFLATAAIALNDLGLQRIRLSNEIARMQSQISLYKAFLHGGNEIEASETMAGGLPAGA
jgi:hypothetical protein